MKVAGAGHGALVSREVSRRVVKGCMVVAAAGMVCAAKAWSVLLEVPEVAIFYKSGGKG